MPTASIPPSNQTPAAQDAGRRADAVTIWGLRHSGLRTTALPLFLILVTPFTTILLWLTCVYHGGSFRAFIGEFSWSSLAARWPWPSSTAVGMCVLWAGLQTLLLVALPGSSHEGPVTPMGSRPRYKLNGVAAFLVSHALLYVAAYPLGWFSPTIVYDHFGSLLITLSLLALVICAVLYFKGAHFPSGPDASVSGNLIFDYYWGTELHPTVFGLQLKQLFNCRFAMMGWSVILLSFMAKQHQLYGTVSNSMLISVALQIVYIFKFFVWEGGYFNSLDIMHDRFGYYICWGVTAWLPCIYTLVGLFLVQHPFVLSGPWALFIVAFGLGSIWMNYSADAQRQRVRASNGEAHVWGKPPELIRASYRTGDGEQRGSLLLVSGYWGISRHFHYIPEISLAVAWTLPALSGYLLPWFYVIYLTILLADRAARDDGRCREKYGPYWEQYCARVRYKVIPGIY